MIIPVMPRVSFYNVSICLYVKRGNVSGMKIVPIDTPMMNVKRKIEEIGGNL